METRKALNGKKEDGYISIKYSPKNYRMEKHPENNHFLINRANKKYQL
jgi:hypothetical protein